MNTLAIGCTGTVGGYVVNGLIGKGASVRCMTRTAEKRLKMPLEIEGYTADLDRPETLSSAFKGIDTVFLLVPVNKNETRQGLNAVAAATSADVKKIVYLSVFMPAGSAVIPHFNNKIPIEDAVRKSGIPYTILRPNHFFQNDINVMSVILGYGIYPTPLGSVGLNRVDVRDVAECAVNALTQAGHEGRIYALHGPDTLNGEEIAELYSKYASRKVRYAGDDLEAWVQHVRNVMPKWSYQDLRVMYKYFQGHGMIASDEDLEKQTLVLGHDPRTFDDFARTASEEWKSSLACAA